MLSAKPDRPADPLTGKSDLEEKAVRLLQYFAILLA
jgi:hypothetical protein